MKDVTLKKGQMQFVLKNGETFTISKEDCEEIGSYIVAGTIINTKNIILVPKDDSLQKATFLFEVLKQQKTSSKHIIDAYLKQISDILAGNGKRYIHLHDKDNTNEYQETEDETVGSAAAKIDIMK